MGECFQDDLSEEEYLPAAKKKAAGLEKRSGFEVIEKEVIGTVVNQKSAINILSVCDRLQKHLTQMYNSKTLELGASKASLEELEAAVRSLKQRCLTVTARLGSLEQYSERFQAETCRAADDFFGGLSAEVKTTITLIFDPPPEDDDAWSSAIIKPLKRLVKSMTSSMSSLEAANRAELQTKLSEVNRQVTQLLAQQMSNYKHRILEAMLSKQRDLRNQLCATIQPLLQLLTDEAGQALNVMLKSETLNLPDMNLEEFERETDKRMQEMVEDKKGKVLKTRDHQEVKHGACGKTWTETTREEYHETETTGYKVTRQRLMDLFMKRVQDQIQVSKRSTRLLIEHEIIGEVKTVQEMVQMRCQGFMETLEQSIKQKHVQTGQEHMCRSSLEKSIADIQLLLDLLDKVKDKFNEADMLITSSSQGENYLDQEPEFEFVDTCETSSPHGRSGNGMSPAGAGAQ
ncbi:unnamed protein product [Polarella glacialis]|uniref:Uncharacterized protein n=1 Tax=Polarella glacialis TaxID=89957 RepID=A0A813GQ60_POLGL|nr:unnamed protein product [Polarella glacialis]